MLYWGTFRNQTHNTLYRVEIVTNNSTASSTELTFSDEPVVIETSSDSLFAPIKSRSCTIEIVTDEIYYDLYAAAAQQNTVKVKKNNEVIFSGYLSPCIYSQDWNYKSKLSLEAVDKLSTLQYYRYEVQNPAMGFQYISFGQLIVTCLRKAGYTGGYYWPKNNLSLYSSSTPGAGFLYEAGISETNLFDDDDEATPWTYEDVLKEICTYLGVTAVPQGEWVYFVDYQQTANGTNDFHKVDLAGNRSDYSSPGVLLHTANVKGTPSLSLDEVFNKISVSCSIYEYGKDEGSLDTTLFSNNTMQNFIAWGYGSAYYDFWTSYTNIYTKDKTVPYECYIKMYYPKSNNKWSIRYFESNIMSGQLYHPTEYAPPSGQKQIEYTSSSDINWCYGNLDVESVYTGQHHYEGFKEAGMQMTEGNLDFWKKCVMKNIPVLERYFVTKRDDQALQSDWKECIMFTPVNRNLGLVLKDYIKAHYATAASQIVHPTHPTYSYTYYNWYEFMNHPSWTHELTDLFIASNVKPVLEFHDSAEINYTPDDGTAYITIDCNLMYVQDNAYRDDNTIYTARVWYQHDFNPGNAFFPMDELGYTQHRLFERAHGDADFNKGWRCLKVRVECGGKYWNGSSWTSSISDFDLYFHSGRADSNDPDAKEKFNLYEWQKIVYNTTYKDSVGKEVYAIPVKPDDNIKGRLTVLIYTPYMCTINERQFITQNAANHIQHFWIDVSACPIHIFMQDLAIDYVRPTSDWTDDEKEEDEDIVYSNVINDAYVQELDDIEMKINTVVEKKPMSRSYVMQMNGTEFTKEMYNRTTGHNLIPEKHVIEKYYNHYSQPKRIFDLDMMFNGAKDPASAVTYNALTSNTLVIDEEEQNLLTGIDKIKLVEF